MNHKSIIGTFADMYGDPELVVRSPGRINLIGEHTDYNDGFVLPAAIDKELRFAVSASDQSYSVLHACDIDEKVNIAFGTTMKDTLPIWGRYLFGVIDLLHRRGLRPGTVNCVFGGNIPHGAGLSSSAALSCGFAFALNELFDLGLTKKDIILIGQETEHTYIGLQCGIMDQFASVFSRDNHAIELDCRDLSHTYVPVDLGEYQLLLVNSHVTHELADSEYNKRREECNEGVSHLQEIGHHITSLRDATIEQLQAHSEAIPPIVYMRCQFVLEENQRVHQAADALRTGDLEELGRLLYSSHFGLKDLYEVTCAQTDFLVSRAREFGILGARQMGGGFGGCTLNLVSAHQQDDFIMYIQQSYNEAYHIVPECYPVSIAKGTSRVY